MNVCEGETKAIHGMPAAFFNRYCLEQCHDVKDVSRFVANHTPLGPYHLTVADPDRGVSFHMKQSDRSENAINTVRRWEKDHPLITLNFRYSPSPQGSFFYSPERQAVLNNFFLHRGRRALEEALALPFTNNSLTTHRVVMEPKTKTFKVAFDDEFAGEIPLHQVATQSLL